MKSRILLSGLTALSLLTTTVSAQVVVNISGSSALRGVAIDAILASYGSGLTDFAHTDKNGEVRTARQSIFRGNFPPLGDTIIRCTWSGSLQGIGALASYYSFEEINQSFLHPSALASEYYADNFSVGGVAGTHSVGNGQDLAYPGIVFSDVLPTTSPFDVQNIVTIYDSGPHPVQTQDSFGVFPYVMVADQGAPAEWTNVTAGQFRALFGNGFLPLNYFVPTNDSRKVYATGSNDGSGTRTIALAETAYAVYSVVQQWKPVTTGAEPTLQVNTLRLWPQNDGVNRSITWGPDNPGNGGFESDGSLRAVLGATSTNVQLLNSQGSPIGNPGPLLMLSVLGLDDAKIAVANGAKALSYNGVRITPTVPLSASDHAEITEGAYTLWSYAYLLVNYLYTPPEVVAVLAELQSYVQPEVGLQQMNVSRWDDGATVAP